MGPSQFLLVVFAVFKITGTLSYTNVQYMYRFIAVNALKAEDFLNQNDDHGINKFEMIKTIQTNFQISKFLTTVPVALQNLYTTLEGFQADHCLLVIDNWQGVNIKQTAVMPVMLRKLEQALSHRKLRVHSRHLEYLDAVMMPTNHYFKNNTFSGYYLTEDKYQNCPISNFYYPLQASKINDAFCVEINHEKFLLKSKPWQCEIRINLLMPKHLLKFHNFPGIFRYNYDFDFKFLPSSRPNIHVFLDLSGAKEINSRDLLEWISNKKHSGTYAHVSYFKNEYWTQNYMHLSGQVVCRVYKDAQMFDRQCDILNLGRINLCFDCPNYTVSTSINQKILSFEYLASENQRADRLWFGETSCRIYSKKFYSLCLRIDYFQNTKYETIIAPLKNLHKIKSKYSNNIQILAFAFASVFAHLLGNHTNDDKYNFLYWGHLRTRSIELVESIFDDKNVALHFQNKFGSLRFVSCGSRGFEDLQIERFVSVFEKKIWNFMLAVAIALTIVMNILRGSMCLGLYSLDKVICLIMVVLEQGNPFPERFIRSSSFRFLICGTLLGGLVLSNAFKSTNVYNIVLPRIPLEFGVIDELLVHGYSVYSKLAKIYFLYENFGNDTQTKTVVVNQYKFYKYLSVGVRGSSRG